MVYNMESWTVILTLGASLVLLVNVQCNEDIVSVKNRIDSIDEDIIRVEERVVHQIDSAKISLRSEFKKYLHGYVAEAMKKIIQGESIEEMVRSQVLSEVRQLKRGNHQMKRQLHQVFTSNRYLQEELNMYTEELKKVDREANDMKMCSKYIVNFEIMRKDLEQFCRQHTEDKDKKLVEIEDNLNILNQTHQLHMRYIDMTTASAQTTTIPESTRTSTSVVAPVTTTTPELTTTSTSVVAPVTTTTPESTTTSVVAPVTTTTPESTTTSTSVVAPVTTTTGKPEAERNRIIVAPIWSSTHHQFRLIDIHSNIVSTYRLRSLQRVLSLAYVSRLRKLLIGLYSPDKIISSNLDSNDVITMRKNVRTYGMAVDEERELVFMSTHAPRYTISRMTTQEKHFSTIIDLTGYGSAPRAIAVNTKDKIIYACNYDKVFTVTYNGRHLQTLATGSSIHALTLDNTGNILYYNDGKNLMSLSQNATKEVTTLSVIPWNIHYYKDTMYFSSYDSSPAVGAVDVAHDTVMYTLQQTIIKGHSRYIICLLP